jgi:hypothetical protein
VCGFRPGRSLREGKLDTRLERLAEIVRDHEDRIRALERRRSGQVATRHD